MDRREQALWIREQRKVEDILATIKKKKWAWEGHFMRRTDNTQVDNQSNIVATQEL